MAEIRVRKRHRLREKEVKSLADEILARSGAELFRPGEPVDRAESSDFDIIFSEGEAAAIVIEGKAFPTIRGLLKHPATKSFVVVDMGAVPFVTKGADVMGPGIVDVDKGITKGDMVWVKDVKNGRPLSIGIALMDGELMSTKPAGKSIRTVHHVTDKLWKLGEE